MIDDAYQLYRERTANSKPDAPKATRFRQDFAVADRTEIEFMGVWDTVGELGIPVPFWGVLGEKKYHFHDTEPSGIIQHARHAVSIDENRENYPPALWDQKDEIDLLQVWFAGAHSDIGGAYKDRALGDLAGQWILDEAGKFGLQAEAHLLGSIQPNYKGRKHDEYKGLFALRGKTDRNLEPIVHQSVKDRWDDPTVKYQSPALEQLLNSVNRDWNKIQLIG